MTINLHENLPEIEEYPLDRLEVFEAMAKLVLESQNYSRDFDDFTENQTQLVQEGDKLVCLRQCTGYNIILEEDDCLL